MDSFATFLKELGEKHMEFLEEFPALKEKLRSSFEMGMSICY
jgi:hypothetical protein